MLASLVGVLIRLLMLIFLFEILLMRLETAKGWIDLQFFTRAGVLKLL